MICIMTKAVSEYKESMDHCWSYITFCLWKVISYDKLYFTVY